MFQEWLNEYYEIINKEDMKQNINYCPMCGKRLGD